nr:nuclear transport factor 2 family protein [Burkholderia cenocepacia]
MRSTVFTPDAAIDCRAMGGIAGRYPDVKAWLRTVLPRFPRYQHLVGNLSIRLDGDTARGRTIASIRWKSRCRTAARR